MQAFTSTIKKFGTYGEKTGWHYIEVTSGIAGKLKPNNKRAFRVKGKLDNYSFEGMSLLPMGNGNFILALNAEIRRKIRKQTGAEVMVKMEADARPVQLNKELLECLADEPECLEYFNSLNPSHRKYFSNYIDGAKTEPTRTKRIAETLNALSQRMNFGQMLRDIQRKK